MQYESLFFDLDDTLWDTYHNNKECLEEVYTDYAFGRYYASFEAFFNVYWSINNKLWEQYRNHEIDKQTLTVERFRPVLQPLGMDDLPTVMRINEDFLQRCSARRALCPVLSNCWTTCVPLTGCISCRTGFAKCSTRSWRIQGWHLTSIK